MFPTIIKGLKGTDTNIEIVTQLTLETIRMSVNNFRAVRKTAFIFVYTELKIVNEALLLKQIKKWDQELAAGEMSERIYKCQIAAYPLSIEYTDAKARASAAEKFFREILDI